MANYSLILDTKFKPFSYAEMLAPVAAATQAHQAIEEEYGNLKTKANVWEGIANEQTDPYAYKLYKTYSDDLEARAEELMKYGLNASSRKGMLDMRARYSKEIIPIENAYKRRKELADEQREALKQNPTLRYQRMARTMSLDDFIKNPSLDYGESYSGALLTQQVSQAAANYAKVLTQEGKLEKLGLPFQYKQKLQHGATPEQVLAVINEAAKNGEPAAVSFLRGIRDQVLKSSGVASWADDRTMKEFEAYANQGLYSALGQAEIKDYTDQAGLAKYKADLDDRNNARQFARQLAAKKQEGENELKQRIALGADSFLNTSGDLSKYRGLVSTLFTKDGKLKASYFGKTLDRNGNARDPLAVYEQYWKAYNDAYKAAAKYNNEVINRKSTPKSTSPAYSIGRGTYIGRGAFSIGRGKNPKEEALKAANAVLRQHKVTAVLTKDQYNALKELKINTHYNSRKNGSMVDFQGTLVNAINSKGAQTSFYSTKMSDYSYIDGVISRNLSWRNSSGTYNDLVYNLTADGKKGKAASFKSLGFKDDDTSKHVTDVAYSAIHPDKIIVTIGGSKYLMAPEVLGGEYAGIIDIAQQALREGTSKDEVSYNTTVAIAGLLNSYNPVRSKSSSEFE